MDNDLMAQRLGPPSEPPRPQNGHSPWQSATPPWAAAPVSADAVPWDRPEPELWPPAALEDERTVELWPPATTPAASAPTAAASAETQGDEQVVTTSANETSDAPAQAETLTDFGAWLSSDPYAQQETEDALDLEPDTITTAESADNDQVAVETAAAVDEDSTDVSVPGRAPWDTPAAFYFDEPGMFDDRPSQMLASYDEMIPMVASAVAAATAAAQQTSTDPDDALAPVLLDVSEPYRPSWPEWSATPAVVTPPAPAAVPPVTAWGSVVGPTPPVDLFTEPEATVMPETDSEPQPGAEQVMEAQLDHGYVTTESEAAEADQEPHVASVELGADPASESEPQTVNDEFATYEEFESVYETHPDWQLESLAIALEGPAADSQSESEWQATADFEADPEPAQQSNSTATESEPEAEWQVATAEAEPELQSVWTAADGEREPQPVWTVAEPQPELESAAEPVAEPEPESEWQRAEFEASREVTAGWPAAGVFELAPESSSDSDIATGESEDAPATAEVESQPQTVAAMAEADPEAEVESVMAVEPDAEPTTAAVPEQVSAVAPISVSTAVMPLPTIFSTAPSAPPQQLMLRIDLAIVEASQLRSAETAKRVGPWPAAGTEPTQPTEATEGADPELAVTDTPDPSPAAATNPVPADLSWAIPALSMPDGDQPPTVATAPDPAADLSWFDPADVAPSVDEPTASFEETRDQVAAAPESVPEPSWPAPAPEPVPTELPWALPALEPVRTPVDATGAYNGTVTNELVKSPEEPVVAAPEPARKPGWLLPRIEAHAAAAEVHAGPRSDSVTAPPRTTAPTNPDPNATSAWFLQSDSATSDPASHPPGAASPPTTGTSSSMESHYAPASAATAAPAVTQPNPKRWFSRLNRKV